MYIFNVQNEDYAYKVVAESMLDAIVIFREKTNSWPSLVSAETNDEDLVLLPPPGYHPFPIIK